MFRGFIIAIGSERVGTGSSNASARQFLNSHPGVGKPRIVVKYAE